ncbi:MAG: hypothetical protein H7338_01945 [Candidatus Sericytochromatia bacterium]|nr:hypothetical protein [Candidatus Sericytochromatia bacterium]
MSTLFHSALRVRQFFTEFLPQPPSTELMRMVQDLCNAAGRPLQFKIFDDNVHGETEFNPESVLLGLGAAAPSEGLIAHELAHALLETRGWPRYFGTEAGDHWLGKVQVILLNLADHSAGIGLQVHYGIDARAHEEVLLAQSEASIQRLLDRADLIPKVGLSGSQLVEFGTGIALTCLDYYWRTGGLPDSFFAAMDLIDGSRDLFTSLAECAPDGVPQDGGAARRLMGTLIERIDDYLQEEAGIRPLALLGHFVPSSFANDVHRPVEQVATLLQKALPTPGDFLITVIPHRDGLPFSFRQILPPHQGDDAFLNWTGQQPFGALARQVVPPEYLIWQPTGSPV